MTASLRARQRLGKYRIVRRLASGPLSTVYQAYDAVEELRVALKVLRLERIDEETRAALRREVRIGSRLEHPNILAIKNAVVVDGLLLLAYPLGEQTLDERLRRRLSTAVTLGYAHQLLCALAHAHEHGVIHCDVKPDNVILFSHNRLRLTDFGLAKITRRTIRASGSGTIGYVAPEQAMGRPSRRSDVFSAGLVIYRMLTGQLPEWPFPWPPPGHARLRDKVGPAFRMLLQRALRVPPRQRFADGREMLAAFHQVCRCPCPACGRQLPRRRSRG